MRGGATSPWAPDARALVARAVAVASPNRTVTVTSCGPGPRDHASTEAPWRCAIETAADAPDETGSLVGDERRQQLLVGSWISQEVNTVNEDRLRDGLRPLDLDDRFAHAVAASPRHAAAGFMANPDEIDAILAGGAARARALAAPYLDELRAAVGIR